MNELELYVLKHLQRMHTSISNNIRMETIHTMKQTWVLEMVKLMYSRTLLTISHIGGLSMAGATGGDSESE